MNDPEKLLKVNSSSLVDLKAELIRKQQEFRKEKASGGSKSALLAAKRAAHKKVSVFSKKNAGVEERSQKDAEEKAEEENTLQQSRSILEAKAKLYEKMATGGGLDLPDDESGGGKFLVDFQQKSVDDALQKRLERRRREEIEEQEERNKLLAEEKRKAEREKVEAEEEKKELLKIVPESQDPEEQWVDYVDEFGRNRRCLKKDLPSFQVQKKGSREDRSELIDSSKLEVKDLMSSDMYREMLREKWEEEQQDLLSQDAVHYANVRFDERRSHGVGFYDFAKDEESRQEQMKALSDLRDKTLEARQRKEKLKEKRKALMAARLAKVRQRKMVNNEEDAEKVENSDEDEDFIGPAVSEAVQSQKPVEPELLTRDETLRRNAPVREWDKGKKDTSTWMYRPERDPEKSYIESRREERDAEFAPPQIYRESGTTNKAVGTNSTRTREGRAGEFGPPSDYFTVPVKKPRMDTSTQLEQRDESKSISFSNAINTGLSNIRADVHVKRNKEITENVRDIPLPADGGADGQAKDDLHTYHHMESQFYPGQFSSAPPGVHHVFPYSAMPPPPVRSSGQPYPPGVDSREFSKPPSFVHQTPGTGLGLSDNSTLAQAGGALFSGTSEKTVGEVNSHEIATAKPASGSTISSENEQSKPDAKEEPSVTEGSEQTSAVSGTTISAKPMIYNRIGSRTDAPVRPRYERVHLHQVPLTLPAPPSASNTPHYPSQEEVHKVNKDKQEKDSVKQWLTQYSDTKPTQKTSAKLPFPSPYVQKDPSNKKDNLFETAGFDPSKPPPSMSASNS